MGFWTLTKKEEDSFSLEIPPQLAKQAVEAALHRLGLPLSEDAGLRLLYRERSRLLGNPADIEFRLEPVESTSTRVQIEVRRFGSDVKPTVASLLAQVRAATCDAAAPAERAARTARQIEVSPGYLRLKRLQEIENHRPLSPEEQSEFQRLQDAHAKLTSRTADTASTPPSKGDSPSFLQSGKANHSVSSKRVVTYGSILGVLCLFSVYFYNKSMGVPNETEPRATFSGAIPTPPPPPPPKIPSSPPSVEAGKVVVNLETGEIVRTEAVPSVAPPRNRLPIQMGWADAESFLRRKGYPTVEPAQEEPTWLRANDRRCGDYGEDCSSIRPTILFEYSKRDDTEAPKCITVFDIKRIDWRAIISEFTGGSGSAVPKTRGRRPRIRTINGASGPVDIVTFPEELMVAMGSGCNDLDDAVREPSAAFDKSPTGKGP